MCTSDRPTTGRSGHRAGRLAAAALAASAVLAPVPGRTTTEPAEEPSAIVMIGGLEPAGALAAAGAEVPRSWRLETLVPRALPAGSANPQIDGLARTYREADFLRCLTRVDQTLDPD